MEKLYPTDMTAEQWELMEPCYPLKSYLADHAV
jgi:hypothetical protein